jgi:hypothetical protein
MYWNLSKKLNQHLIIDINIVMITIEVMHASVLINLTSLRSKVLWTTISWCFDCKTVKISWSWCQLISSWKKRSCNDLHHTCQRSLAINDEIMWWACIIVMRNSTESTTLNTCILNLAILKFTTFKQNINLRLQSNESIKASWISSNISSDCTQIWIIIYLMRLAWCIYEWRLMKSSWMSLSASYTSLLIMLIC